MDLESSQNQILELKKENVRELAQIIKTIAFKDYGSIHPYDNGVKITVDDGVSQQANAYLASSFFSTFVVKDDDIHLKVPMKTIYEVLSIPEGLSSSVKFTYAAHFEPLKMFVEESEGCVIRAKINTSIPDQDLDFEFQDTELIATYLMKTQALREIFRDFDDTCKSVKMEFTQTELRFSTDGEVGEITVAIPSKSLQMESVKVKEDVSFHYIPSLLQRMNLAFSIATKVVFRVDSRGVLCCQFTIENDEEKSYVEFLTVPTQEEEE